MMDRRLLHTTKQLRVAAQREFVERCRATDGVPDFDALRLPQREAPVQQWRARYLTNRDPSTPATAEGADRLERWLGFLQVANTTEDWSVRRALRLHHPRLRRGDVRARDVADLQEIYHSMAFADVLALFGKRPASAESTRALRASIALVQALPPSVARLPVLVAEMTGAVVIAGVLREGQEILRADPERSDAVTQRLESVLADEIGHALLLISRCNWLQLRLLPLFVAIAGRSPGLRRIPGRDYGRDIRRWRLQLFPASTLDQTVIPSAFAATRAP